MTESEKRVAEALIEEVCRRAFVWNPNDGIPDDNGMGLGVDGNVDFERLARVAIEAVRNNPQPAGLNS